MEHKIIDESVWWQCEQTASPFDDLGKAIARFKKKTGQRPTRVAVHPAHYDAKIAASCGLIVVTQTSVLRGHLKLWRIGEDEDKQEAILDRGDRRDLGHTPINSGGCDHTPSVLNMVANTEA